MGASEIAAKPGTVQAPPAHPAILKIISFPVMTGLMLVGVMFVALRSFVVDPDVWWHLKVGSTILATHHFPTSDPYSFTAHGAPWIAYEWLGDLLLAWVHSLAGLQGLMALDVVLTAAIVMALYALCTRRCRNSKAAFVACLLNLPLVYASCSLRPQMLGYLFLLLALMVLESAREGNSRILFLLPPLFLIWVNTHGSFTIGLFAVMVYFASGLVQIKWGDVESRLWTETERIRMEAVILLILVALVITPYGTQICLYPLDMAFSQPVNVGNILEWQSMAFGEFFGKYFLAIVLAFMLAQAALRTRWRLEWLVLFLAGVFAACVHLRFVLIFVPFSAPVLAMILGRGIPPYDPRVDKYPLNALLMAVIAAGLFHFFPSRAALESIVRQKWPVRAVAYLRAHPTPQPMFNTYGYGGYLIWQLDGQNKVFIDGRGDIYEREGVFTDYLDISRLVLTTPMLLNAYNIQSCLVNRDDALATWLEAVPGWRKVYSDPLSVLYVRAGKDAGKGAQ